MNQREEAASTDARHRTFHYRRAAVIATVFVVSMLVILGALHPRHQGRTPLEWIHHGFLPNTHRSGTGREAGEATTALKLMGPEALPTIMKEFTHTESELGRNIRTLKKKYPVLGLPEATESERRAAALWAIKALGENAAQVLLRTLESKDPSLRACALGSLGYLDRRITQSHEFSRTATPLLLDILRNGNAIAQNSVGYRLSRLALTHPEEVAEALVAIPIFHTRQKNTRLQDGIVTCLDLYGRRAKAAAPRLVSALEQIDAAIARDTESELYHVFIPLLKNWRKDVYAALESVDPEAAEAHRPKPELREGSPGSPGSEGIRSFLQPAASDPGKPRAD